MPPSLYAAPRLYDRLFAERSDDVRFYTRLAEGRDSVLEYGVGTGRVAIPLARVGHRVTGVDDAAAMLDALADRAEDEAPSVRDRLRWVLGDAREMRLDARFPLVTMPFNGLAHMTDRASLYAFFESVRSHLEPGGLFAFDVWLPDPRLLCGSVLEGPRAPDPLTGEIVTLREVYRYEAMTQILRVEISITLAMSGLVREVYTLSQRQFFPEETRALLELHGLDVQWQTTRWKDPPATGCTKVDGASHDAGEMVAWVCSVR